LIIEDGRRIVEYFKKGERKRDDKGRVFAKMQSANDWYSRYLTKRRVCMDELLDGNDTFLNYENFPGTCGHAICPLSGLCRPIGNLVGSVTGLVLAGTNLHSLHGFWDGCWFCSDYCKQKGLTDSQSYSVSPDASYNSLQLYRDNLPKAASLSPRSLPVSLRLQPSTRPLVTYPRFTVNTT